MFPGVSKLQFQALQHFARERRVEGALDGQRIAVQRRDDGHQGAHVPAHPDDHVFEDLHGERKAALGGVGGEGSALLLVGQRHEADAERLGQPAAQILAQRQCGGGEALITRIDFRPEF